MANINTKVWRFESGGAVNITPSGGSASTIKNIQAGTLRIKLPSRERHQVVDRSVLELPVEGDDIAGEFELEVRCGGVGATELIGLLTANAATSGTNAGRAFPNSLTATTLEARGGSAVKTMTLSSLWVDAGGLEYTAAKEFDLLKIRGSFLTYAEA